MCWCRSKQSSSLFHDLSTPLGWSLSNLAITVISQVLYDRLEEQNSRKRLDFPLFRILLHCHSFTLPLCICFRISSSLYCQPSHLDLTVTRVTYHLILGLPPIFPLFSRVTSQILPYSREVCDSNLILHEVSNFNSELSQIIYYQWPSWSFDYNEKKRWHTDRFALSCW